MAVKKNFYAIAKGRRPGIYNNWPEAKAQVMGFAGARYKGFVSREEAEAWLKNPSSTVPKGVSKKAGKKAVPVGPGRAADVLIYTDGGARFNPGPGGYGVVILENGKEQEFSGGYRLTTNNRMELMACIVALRRMRDSKKTINLYSDSQYVVNGITKGWARGWRKRGWLKSDKQPAINPDLWQELLELTENLDVEFRWVRGHAGNHYNERCDQLAVAAAAGADLPRDKGYQG